MNNDLATRFTEKRYATKNEVSHELKISVIDGVWDKILSYRSMYYKYLSIRGVDKNQLRVCLCPTISNKSNNVETKVAKLFYEFCKLDRVSGDSQHFEQTNYIKCLQNISLRNNLIGDEEAIRSIIHGNRTDRDLFNYFQALKFIKENYSKPIDVDYLADLYSQVTGNPELTSFYREIDNEDVNSSAIISRRYKSAPHQLIEQMMDGLFTFIENKNLGTTNKALIAYYYVQFVKPFTKYNEEIAILIAKSILAHESIQEFGACFPLESLLNDNASEVNKLFDEVQATSDVTYYLTFALDSISRLVDRSLDNIIEYGTQIIKHDYYQLDEEPKEEVKEEKVEEPKPEEKPYVNAYENKPEPAPIVREVVREIIREVPVPTPAPQPVEEKKEEPVKETPKVEMTENVSKGLAVQFIPPELDEKTALRLERHLLELDVRLKKGQAYFYARHCTLGMYYTIDQYKKAVKCVYETARTSMDQLAEFGYYEKKQVGKKFVYTPVERK